MCPISIEGYIAKIQHSLTYVYMETHIFSIKEFRKIINKHFYLK